MKINVKQTGDKIIDLVGGVNNISSFTHCLTRLRFYLRDPAKAKTEEIKKVHGVLGALYKMGQYQVVLGENVGPVFDYVEKNYGIKSEELQGVDQEAVAKEDKKRNENIFQRVIEFISSSVTPFVTVIYGAGMLQVFLSLASSIWPTIKTNDTYMMFYWLAQTAFYFMPILIAYGTAKYMKGNPVFSMTVTAALLYPEFMKYVGSSKTLTLFGIPVMANSYASSLLPALLVSILVVYLERFFNKVVPGVLRAVFAPMLTLAVAMPIAFLVLAPLGSILGNYVVQFFVWLYAHLGGITLGLLAGSLPFIIIGGMNMMFAPFMVQNLSSLGYDSIFRPAFIMHNMAEGGACLGVAIRTKNKELKTNAISCAISAIISGVTEPALYGITLKCGTLKYVIGSAAVGGILAGFLGAKAFAMGYSSILAIPIFGKTIVAVSIAIAVTILLSMLTTAIFGFDDSWMSES